MKDATKKLPADKAVTREDAEGVIGAEIRNKPDMSTSPGGVAASMAACRLVKPYITAARSRRFLGSMNRSTTPHAEPSVRPGEVGPPPQCRHLPGVPGALAASSELPALDHHQVRMSDEDEAMCIERCCFLNQFRGGWT